MYVTLMQKKKANQCTNVIDRDEDDGEKRKKPINLCIRVPNDDSCDPEAREPDNCESETRRLDSGDRETDNAESQTVILSVYSDAAISRDDDRSIWTDTLVSPDQFSNDARSNDLIYLFVNLLISLFIYLFILS